MSKLSTADARRALTAAQKPAVGVPAYLRWINRPLGGRFAVRAATWGWTPNGVTALSALFGVGGVLTLALVTDWWAGLLAAGLLLIGYILDSADGQLARIQRRGGPAGEWLDHVVDGIRAPLVHIAVGVHLFRTEAPLWTVLVAGLFSVVVSAWFLSQLLAEKLLPKAAASAEPPRSGVLDSVVKQPQDPSTTYFVLLLIGVPVLFVAVYAALAAWHLVIFAASLRRKHRQLVAI